MQEIKDKQKLLDALLTPCPPSEEHKVLWRLLGVWEAEGVWYYVPGKASTSVQTTMTHTRILGGLFVEAKVELESAVASRVIFGYDPSEAHYTARAFSSVTTRVDFEHGSYDARNDTLTFYGTEPYPNSDKEIGYERKYIFRGHDAIDFELLYTDLPPERREGMIIRMTRVKD